MDRLTPEMKELWQAVEGLEDYASTEDLPEQLQELRDSLYQGTDGYEYSLFHGGRVKPEHIYNTKNCTEVWNAVSVIQAFIENYDFLAGGEQ